MPYLRCAGCGVLSYAPRDASASNCPECGLPVRPINARRLMEAPTADPGHHLDELLRMTRELLDADVALLTAIGGGHETATLAVGDWPPLGSLQGASLPLKDTFCQRMLEGQIGNYICDAASDERVSDLAMARELGVRAWMGVPIEVSETELYILCCMAREARPSLGERELRLLSGLAASVRAVLDAR